MTYVSQSPNTVSISEVAGDAARSTGATLAARVLSMVGRIVERIDAIADHYAAWAAYEQLQRLSDAELRRRGLSREMLARDVLLTQSRAARSE